MDRRTGKSWPLDPINFGSKQDVSYKKGKLGQPVQLGYKVQVGEAEGGFGTGYTVEHGNPADVDALIPALDQHRAQFGRDPALVATDRGYDSAENQRRVRERKIL